MADDDDANVLSFSAALVAAAARWRESFRADVASRSSSAAAGAGGDILAHLALTSVPQAVLTQRTGLTKQAVQQLLDQLEAAGLVRRDADPQDKRAKHVVLTEQGCEALAVRSQVETQLEDALRDRLGKKQFKKLRRILREIAAS